MAKEPKMHKRAAGFSHDERAYTFCGCFLWKTTLNDDEVTCKHCLREMEWAAIQNQKAPVKEAL